MKLIGHCLVLVAIGLCSACAKLPDDCTALPGGGPFCLQPSTAVTTFSVQQKVDVRLGQRRETMIAALESDASGMQFIGLTPFGQKFMDVKYDNRTVQVLQSPSEKMPPAMLLALMQIALWPSEAVQRGLGDLYQVQDNAGERLVLSNGEVIVRVEHDATGVPYRRMHVMIPAIDLELEMQTLTDEPATVQERKQ
jgi:hypothetical protein